MNSPIKLPAPSFYQKHEDVCGDEVGPPTPFWNQAAVEQAVRDALAAQVPVAACLPGYGCTIVSTDLDHLGRSGWRGLAIIPENNHE